jgi:hypothetical protein
MADTFYETLTAAVAEFTERGFESEEQLAEWMRRIREAAERDLVDPRTLEAELAGTFRSLYENLVDRGGILRYHQGVPEFNLKQLAPKLRPLLDQRLMANANLIKNNRTIAIEQTNRRFAGWATSIPAGGSKAVDKREVKSSIRKALAALPFEERRVLIDQGHKFVSDLNNVIALDNRAIAAEWHSHFRQVGYNYRPDHKERDGKFYAIRGNWALAQGFMKAVDGHYTDTITKPGEEVFCRCSYRYIYNLRDLPEMMLTKKGIEELGRVQELIKSKIQRS